MNGLEFPNIVDGERRRGKETHKGTNPRSEEQLWDAPLASLQDLDDAVQAAHRALKTWSKTSVPERQALLMKLSERLQAHEQELMDILMQETGKSSLLAEIEIKNTRHQTEYYTKVGLEDELAYEDDALRIVTTHTPLGLIGAICPWNFPLILSNIKVVSALVTGNCVLLKPSPFTPYTVLRSIELTHDLFPPGVVQVLNGGADLGTAMTRHPGVAKISFTGTISTGKKVMQACAATLKRLTLELAGNDAGVVCEDVDVQKVAAQVASGSFFNGGQMCVCTKRVYVHEAIYDEFLDAFKAAVEGGFAIQRDGAVPSPFGPLSNKMQFEVVREIVSDCKKNGYNIVSGGTIPSDGGYWIPPTIVAKPPEDSMLVREEQFGPIIPVMSWSSEDEVVARANLGNAGLGASVYSSDVARAERIARRMEAGTVWINMPELPHPGGYFSGQKDSGHGGEMGKQGLLSYSYTQSLQFAK